MGDDDDRMMDALGRMQPGERADVNGVELLSIRPGWDLRLVMNTRTPGWLRARLMRRIARRVDDER